MKNDNSIIKNIAERGYFLELVDDTAVLQMYADDFSQLTVNDRLKAYYFIKAALAGRDIYCDQNYRYALLIRNLLEEILVHNNGIEAGLINRIEEYAKLFWINNSQYDERSKKKFIPKFSYSELCEAAEKASMNGATFSYPENIYSVHELLELLKDSVFNPEFESLITNKNPAGKGDLITESANNFYYKISLSDLEYYTEKYPLNSRLIKENEVVFEQVYRAGSHEKNIPAGLYHQELSQVIYWLKQSLPYANETQTSAISHLIDFFESGDEESFNQYNIEWLRDDSQVDLILGFIEVYKDPRGRKASYEAIIYCINQEMTQLMQKFSQNAQYFENNAPWDKRYKKEHVISPVAYAITVLFGTGDGGPTVPLGINLPNSQLLREQYGSKSVLLTNVLEAINGTTGHKIIDEFVHKDARELLKEYSVLSEKLHVALHEVLGHGSGKTNPDLDEDPSYYIKEYYSTLEEARADLVALNSVFDPKMIELGLIPNQQVAEAEYWRYVTSDLTNLRRVKTENIEDDHIRATHLIVSYLMNESNAIEPVEEDGKIFLKIINIETMYLGVQSLLAEIMRIKAEGDYISAKKIVTKHGIHYNHLWHKQIIQRSQDIGLPKYFAFVMPTYIPSLDENGDIVDISIEYQNDLKSQMLSYSNKINRNMGL